MTENKPTRSAIPAYPTPFYYYDTKLLQATLHTISTEAVKHKGFHVHYAVKANANPTLLRMIQEAGLGADCVSGGEIKASIAAGFKPSQIVYAGVGKNDWEINLGLDQDIFCFNVESLPELEVINQLAACKSKIAHIALRINPNIGAHTHSNIVTGLAENKFGIAMHDMHDLIERATKMKHVKLIGLHFHIGSQILDMTDFIKLCKRINELQDQLAEHGITLEHINVGGGLGIDYEHPQAHPIPDFKTYFDTFDTHLKHYPQQQIHFELGRSVVGQCGSLITRVLYVKKGTNKQFVIVDAGMTELIRPALYHATHHIENLNSTMEEETYDVVGPICESSDVFAKDIQLNKTQRGDLLAIRSAGAYGEIMASRYNCRELPKSYFTND